MHWTFLLFVGVVLVALFANSFLHVGSWFAAKTTA